MITFYSLVSYSSKDNVTDQNTKHEYQLRDISQLCLAAYQIPRGDNGLCEHRSIENMFWATAGTFVNGFVDAVEGGWWSNEDNAHLEIESLMYLVARRLC